LLTVLLDAALPLRLESGKGTLSHSKNLTVLENIVEYSSLLKDLPCFGLLAAIHMNQRLSLSEDKKRGTKRVKVEKVPGRGSIQRRVFALMSTIQLTLGSLALRQNKAFNEHNQLSLANSQHTVYQAACTEPVVQGPTFSQVNIAWSLNILNFFRQHILEHDSPLFRQWQLLKPTELPQLSSRLSPTEQTKIGRVWKGTYTFLPREQVMALRNTYRAGDVLFRDQNIINKHPIQTLKLWVPDNEQPSIYPLAWDQIIKGKSLHQEPVVKSSKPNDHSSIRETIRNKTFPYEGIGYDDEQFFCVGHINPLPPQNGIPGFARMTMMKYFRHPDGQMDTNVMWAYEGIVLPGGQIMLGRWWAVEHNRHPREQYSGPFIMWCVDESWDSAKRKVSNNFTCGNNLTV
jgi:hypothetical protein